MRVLCFEGLPREDSTENSSENHQERQKSVRFDYRSKEELLATLRESRENEEQLKDKIFLISSSLKRALSSRETVKGKLNDTRKRGGYEEIAYNVYRAIEEGKTSGKEGALDMLKTISQNLRKESSSKGKRYKQCKTTSEFYESLLLMFGPKACLFVADNNWGPSIDIVKHWKTLNARQLDFSVPKENMKIVAEIYKSFKELNREKRPIPFIFEEDETSI